MRIDELALHLIRLETRRARSIHRPFPGYDSMRCLALMTEEVGEVAEALLVLSRQHKEGKQVDLVSEITQVGAIAVMWLTYLMGENKSNDACQQEADHYSSGGTVGERSEGNDRLVSVSEAERQLGGPYWGGKCGTHGDMAGRRGSNNQNAAAPNRVDKPKD